MSDVSKFAEKHQQKRLALSLESIFDIFKKKKKEEKPKEINPLEELALTETEISEAKKRVLAAEGNVSFKLDYLGEKHTPAELLAILKQHVIFLKETEAFYLTMVAAMKQTNAVTKAFIVDIKACETKEDLSKHTSALHEFQKLVQMEISVKKYLKSLKQVSVEKRGEYSTTKYSDKFQTLIVTTHHGEKDKWKPQDSVELINGTYDSYYYEEAVLVLPRNEQSCVYSCDKKLLGDILDTFEVITNIVISIGSKFSWAGEQNTRLFRDPDNEAYQLFEEVNDLSEEKSDFRFEADNAYGVQENIHQGYVEGLAVDVVQQYQHLLNSILSNTFHSGRSATESFFKPNIQQPPFMKW